MTVEQTKEQFLLAYNSNAYLNMCESDDMHNVIVALEKQIPKKPIKIGEEYSEITRKYEAEYECASCGNPYIDDSYCSCCGQALDWSDTE